MSFSRKPRLIVDDDVPEFLKKNKPKPKPVPRKDVPVVLPKLNANTSFNWRITSRTPQVPESRELSRAPRLFSRGRLSNPSTLTELCVRYVAERIQPFVMDLTESLPLELRDAVFDHAMGLGTLKLRQFNLFLHPGIQRLDFSRYSEEVSDTTIEKMVLLQVNAVASDWEEIDGEAFARIQKGCPAPGSRLPPLDEHIGLLRLSSRRPSDMLRCPDLRDLSLSNCIRISPYLIQRLLLECQNLARLDLSKCSQFRKLRIASPTLTDLDISYTNCVFELQCPQLVSLRYAFCKNYESLDQISGFRKLENLDLANCKVIAQNRPVFFTFLDQVTQSLKALKRLSLMDCGITDWFLQVFLEKKLQLVGLNLSGNLVTTDIVRQLVEKSVYLQELDVTFCTDVAPEELARVRDIYNPKLVIKS